MSNKTISLSCTHLFYLICIFRLKRQSARQSCFARKTLLTFFCKTTLYFCVYLDLLEQLIIILRSWNDIGVTQLRGFINTSKICIQPVAFFSLPELHFRSRKLTIPACVLVSFLEKSALAHQLGNQGTVTFNADADSIIGLVSKF